MSPHGTQAICGKCYSVRRLRCNRPAVSGVVLADHIKCLDWRSRRAEYIGEAPEAVVAEVVRRLGLLLGGDAV